MSLPMPCVAGLLPQSSRPWTGSTILAITEEAELQSKQVSRALARLCYCEISAHPIPSASLVGDSPAATDTMEPQWAISVQGHASRESQAQRGSDAIATVVSQELCRPSQLRRAPATDSLDQAPRAFESCSTPCS